MKHTSITVKLDVQELLEKVAWPLYEKYTNDEGTGHALDGLIAILS
jgi:hypothetical protein